MDDAAKKFVNYATQPTCENIVIRREGERIVATVLPDPRRLIPPLSYPIIWLPMAVGVILAILLPTRGIWQRFFAFLGPALFTFMAMAVTVFQRIMFLRPIQWEASPTSLKCIWRQALAKERMEVRRDDIVDLRIERRRNNQFVKAPSIILQDRAAREHVIFTGRARGLEFLCAHLREGLRLPPDPTHRSSYPPRPPRYAATLLPTPDGAMLNWTPRSANWLGGGVGLIVVMGCWLLGDLLFGQHNRMPWSPSVQPYWIVLRNLFAGGIAFALAVALIRPLVKSTSITIAANRLRLIETGLRACNEEWPIAELHSVELVEPDRRQQPLSWRLLHPFRKRGQAIDLTFVAKQTLPNSRKVDPDLGGAAPVRVALVGRRRDAL